MSTFDPQVLIRQLGTALPMMGAKSLVSGDNFLQFKIGKNPERVTNLKIVLRDDDTYNVEAWRIHGTDVKHLQTFQCVYVDMLHDTLKTLTGLETRL